MLQTQVAYWTLQENVRHNKATEGISAATLTETIRHNKISEAQGQTSLEQGWANLNIQMKRANTEQAKVEVSKQQLAVQRRANDIAYMNAMSNAKNAETNRFKAQTDRQIGFDNLAVARQNAISQSRQAENAASQARNAAKANVIRQQELKQRKTEMWVNNGSNILSNLIKLGGVLLK